MKQSAKQSSDERADDEGQAALTTEALLTLHYSQQMIDQIQALAFLFQRSTHSGLRSKDKISLIPSETARWRPSRVKERKKKMGGCQ